MTTDNKPKEWREWYVARDGSGDRLFQSDMFELACVLCPGREIIHVVEAFCAADLEAKLTAAEREIAELRLERDTRAIPTVEKLRKENAELKTIHSEVVIGALEIKKQNEEQAKEIERRRNEFNIMEDMLVAHRKRESAANEIIAVLEDALRCDNKAIKYQKRDAALVKLAEHRKGRA